MRCYNPVGNSPLTSLIAAVRIEQGRAPPDREGSRRRGSERGAASDVKQDCRKTTREEEVLTRVG
jgi:hypothetical protein